MPGSVDAEEDVTPQTRWAAGKSVELDLEFKHDYEKAAFSPDGKRVCTVSLRADRYFRIWDTTTGDHLLRVRPAIDGGFQPWHYNVVFGRDSNELIFHDNERIYTADLSGKRATGWTLDPATCADRDVRPLLGHTVEEMNVKGVSAGGRYALVQFQMKGGDLKARQHIAVLDLIENRRIDSVCLQDTEFCPAGANIYKWFIFETADRTKFCMGAVIYERLRLRKDSGRSQKNTYGLIWKESPLDAKSHVWYDNVAARRTGAIVSMHPSGAFLTVCMAPDAMVMLEMQNPENSLLMPIHRNPSGFRDMTFDLATGDVVYADGSGGLYKTFSTDKLLVWAGLLPQRPEPYRSLLKRHLGRAATRVLRDGDHALAACLYAGFPGIVKNLDMAVMTRPEIATEVVHRFPSASNRRIELAAAGIQTSGARERD